jgi:MOSC domain-containing protein YiiM
VKFGRDDILKLFLQSRRSGFYFSVLEEGDLAAGDAFEPVSRDPSGVTVADITSLYVNEVRDLELMNRAIALEALPSSWRGYFSKQLNR